MIKISLHGTRKIGGELGDGKLMWSVWVLVTEWPLSQNISTKKTYNKRARNKTQWLVSKNKSKDDVRLVNRPKTIKTKRVDEDKK